jgi:hypothetical protein
MGSKVVLLRTNNWQRHALGLNTGEDAMANSKNSKDSSGKEGSSKDALAGASKYEKFAATQAAGDGIEGDVKKKRKTEDEKLGAQMADRK